VKTEEDREGEAERSRPPGNLVEKYDPYDEGSLFCCIYLVALSSDCCLFVSVEETARRALRSDGAAEDLVTQIPAVTVKEEEISSSGTQCSMF
jgi:hypothetical protein